ncbi:hypothetical protein Tco_0954198 [Tanacetum coccineum]|uniref:Uncharacterized protein n=1 Tax=Tanacetum coccineum TaxID=301880 RepID=A0ABQ5E3F9_9ASTR
MGHVVPLLPIAPAHAESELDASVDKLFDECGNGNQAEQGDSASGGHGVGIQLVSEAAETVVEDAAPVQPRRGKSRFAVQRLLAGSMQNAEVRGEPIPTLPFVTSSVFATPEHSSHHFGANIAEAKVDSFARPSIPLMTVATTVTSTVDHATTVKEKFVESSVFGGGANHIAGGFSDRIGSDFFVGDDGRTCREMVDAFAPPKFFASIRGMELDQLFTEFNVGAARQMSLSAEVRMRAEYNIKERRRLNSGAEAAEAIHLRAEASKFKVVKESLRDEVKVLKEQNAALKQEKTNLSVKVADLAASVKVREQEVADLDA